MHKKQYQLAPIFSNTCLLFLSKLYTKVSSASCNPQKTIYKHSHYFFTVHFRIRRDEAEVSAPNQLYASLPQIANRGELKNQSEFK